MVKKREKKEPCMTEKQLRNVPLLLYENYTISKKELEECKRILESMRQGK